MPKMRYIVCTANKTDITPVAMFRNKKDALGFYPQSHGRAAVIDMETGIDINAPTYSEQELVGLGMTEEEAARVFRYFRQEAERIKKWCEKQRDKN